MEKRCVHLSAPPFIAARNVRPRHRARQPGGARLVLILVAALSLLAAGCQGDTADDADGGAPGSVDPVTLSYANPVGEGDAQAFANTVQPWMEFVQEATDGAASFETSHGGSLLTHPDMMEGVGSGLADMGSAQLSIDPSSFPLWALSGLHDPGIATEIDAFQQTMMTRLMMNEVAALEQELEDANLIMLFSIASSPHHLLTRMNIDGLDDLSGRQIRTYGRFMPRLFESIGAVPVDMSPDEVYTGLDRGVVDGAYSLPSAFVDLGWSEVARQVTRVRQGTTPPLNGGFHLTMNADVWEGLQDELKVAMLEAAREIERQYSETDVPELEAEAFETMEADGLDVAEMSEEDIEAWSEAFPDLWSEFAEELEGAGMPGDELVNTYLELAELDRTEIEERYDAFWDDQISQYQ